MADYSFTMTGSILARLYLWRMLDNLMPDHWELIQNPTSEENTMVIPILPAQEQPEGQTSERPYMVWTSDYTATGDLFQYQRETFAIRMYSQSPATISATTKLIMRIFNRFDESAFDMNMWIQGLNPQGPSLEADYAIGRSEYDKWIDEAKNFQFKTISVSGVEGSQPSGGEGRRVDSLVTINLEYIEKDMGEGFGGRVSASKKASD